mgnify:CR=1 FL=1
MFFINILWFHTFFSPINVRKKVQKKQLSLLLYFPIPYINMQ